jgi:ABC-type phosphate transport system ATPase subunit
MPKNILKIPLKNLGLLIKTTFIKENLHQCLLHAQLIPRIITAMARTPTKNSDGQMQLIAIPTAKAIAKTPLLLLKHFLRIMPPP